MRIGVGHQLVCPLGRAVETQGMVDIVGNAKRHAAVRAVDRRRRGINQMPAFGVPASLKHIEEARDIGVDIGVWIDQGMTHAGLRSEMHDGGKAMRSKQLGDRLPVCDVDPLELEFRERLEVLDPGLLQVWIVIGIEVIDAHHVMPLPQQAVRDMHADESGRPGDENRLLQASSSQWRRSYTRPFERLSDRLRSAGAVWCSIKPKMPRACEQWPACTAR